MLLSILYALLRLLLDLLLVPSRRDLAREVELLVLPQEVRVLCRQARRVRYNPGERLILAGLSRLLPGSEWHRFPLRRGTDWRAWRPPSWRFSPECRA